MWFESPPGVGFSVVGQQNNTITNDTQATEDNLQSLVTFLSLWPEYRTNDLYIAGESYAGVYVPFLAHYVQQYNIGKPAGEQINLKGFLYGNGVTSVKFDHSVETYADFMWWHALYGQQTRDNYTDVCVDNFD